MQYSVERDVIFGLNSHKDRSPAIGPKSRNWLVNQLGNKLRQYKAKLKKKHYKAELPMERVMENAPETVEETQWNTLVSYWYSEEAKVMLSGSFQ